MAGAEGSLLHPERIGSLKTGVQMLGSTSNRRTLAEIIMRLARIVFVVAGIWGIVVLTPLYLLVDVTGRPYAPPTEYPHFFYGFLSVTMVWQIAFLVIGSQPLRYRPLMIPSILEKLSYVAVLAVLYGQARISPMDAAAAAPDMLLGILFILAFVKTRGSEFAVSSSRGTR